MTKRTVLIVTISIICLAAVTYAVFTHKPVTNIEQATRGSVSQEVINAFLAKDFDKLEELAAKYRESKSRTPSGLWLLGRFYYAFYQIYGQRDSVEIWAQASKDAKEWINQFPDSPTPHIAYAHILSKIAWEHRGYGSGSQVEEDDWEPFHENQRSARAYLEQHKSIAARDPHWYALMLSILRTENVDDETIRQYYLEGVKLEPLYFPMHMEALYNFIPKWGGSIEAVDDFILLATRQVEESQRDMLYARLYWASVTNQFPEDRFFHETKVDWNRMKRGMKEVVTEYPDIWNIFYFTFFACFAGDKEVPTKYIPILLKYEGDSWFENYTGYKLCKEWIFNNGPNVAQALVEFNAEMEAEALWQQQLLRNGEKYYEKNLRYKEQIIKDYERLKKEVAKKKFDPSSEEVKRLYEEFGQLHELQHELHMRDLLTDWGLDYDEDSKPE